MSKTKPVKTKPKPRYETRSYPRGVHPSTNARGKTWTSVHYVYDKVKKTRVGFSYQGSLAREHAQKAADRLNRKEEEE